MDRLKVGDLEFKCKLTGKSGPLLVLLHGYGGGPLDWHRLVPTLEEGHRLLIPNLSPLFASAQPIGFSKQVEMVASLINQVNSSRESFVLVGSSYGGTLSWGVRAHFQSLVTGHCLINPMPLDPLSTLKSGNLRMLFGLNMVPGALPLFLKTAMGKSLLHDLAEVFGLGLGNLSERKYNLVSKAVQRFAWIAQNEDWSYWSGQLRDHLVPLLILTGEKDPLFLERDFRMYQHLVPLSEHQTVNEGSHLLLKSHPSEVAQTLTAFVQSLGTDPHLDIETLRHAI